jgi:hypothetical protein
VNHKIEGLHVNIKFCYFCEREVLPKLGGRCPQCNSDLDKIPTTNTDCLESEQIRKTETTFPITLLFYLCFGVSLAFDGINGRFGEIPLAVIIIQVSVPFVVIALPCFVLHLTPLDFDKLKSIVLLVFLTIFWFMLAWGSGYELSAHDFPPPDSARIRFIKITGYPISVGIASASFPLSILTGWKTITKWLREERNKIRVSKEKQAGKIR